jgi:MOSC domain-containing protein YiiM
MTVGKVVALQLKRGHWAALEPVDAVEATWIGLRPGDLREQVTVELPGLMSLAPGTRLRVGQAVLELTGRCEPCTHIGEHVGVDDPEAFRERLVGRRGMLARVSEPGPIRVGDPVEREGP